MTMKGNPMRKFKNLVGETFGKWEVIKHLGTKTTSLYKDRGGIERLMTMRFYLCRCSCGALNEIPVGNLLNKLSKGCKHCVGDPLVREFKQEYHVWKSMLYRCGNINCPQWKDYGGRGIKVCESWLSFENFIKDMGKRPQGLSIDRINNNGNYEPTNCKWSTQKEQIANQRRHGKFAIEDEFTNLKVGRERKRQLRRIKVGLCIRKCEEKIFKSGLCEIHYKEKLKHYALKRKQAA
jgi:hypothetical protein